MKQLIADMRLPEYRYKQLLDAVFLQGCLLYTSDVFFQAIMSVYMDSKKTAREKYTPKKYRKHKDKE